MILSDRLRRLFEFFITFSWLFFLCFEHMFKIYKSVPPPRSPTHSQQIIEGAPLQTTWQDNSDDEHQMAEISNNLATADIIEEEAVNYFTPFFETKLTSMKTIERH